MAIPPDLRDYAYQFFIEEAPELLHVLEAGLLSLHQERRSIAKVHDLMRAAHTLKGGAASVGLNAIATLAHRLENVFKAFYDETLLIDTELETYLLQAYDCLRLPLIEQIKTGHFDSDAALANAEPIFALLEARCGDALLNTDQYISSSTALGVDLVTDIFTVNIAQGLERLAQVVANPHEYQVAGELRALAEVFDGFAEFLNVPEFGSIVHMVRQALEAHPDCALEIAQLALVDFERSRTALLSGNSTQETGASAALIALAQTPTITPPTSNKLTIAESISPVYSSNADTVLQVSQSTEIYQTIPPFYVNPVELPLSQSLSVRVDSERLESMNNLVGELVINREGLFLQNEQILGALRNLRQRFTSFQSYMNDLRQLCDQTLITPERDHLKAKLQSDFSLISEQHAAISGDRLTKPDFDFLEIDQYGALHSHVQVILEEVVQLEEIADDIDLFAKQSEQILAQQQHMLTQLRDDLLQVRMLPLGEVLNRFPRVLRDLSTTYSKPVTLKLTGTDILVEKAIQEKLYDPLLHLLRNAFDHGIEPSEIRRQHSKPEQGQIEICAYKKGNQTIIEVKDDGQGLNLERIRSRAVELGWLSVEQLIDATPVDLYELIFEPGFSTASQVNQLSGRGIGLDLVRSQLQSIKGTITVNSVPKLGTCFTLYLPQTLTIARLMICSSGPTTIALRTDSVIEILTPQPRQIRQSGTQHFLYWQEKIIPLYQLADLLDYTCPLPETPPNRVWASAYTPESWELPVLILRKDRQMVALQVIRLLTEQELVIKPFSAAIAPPSYAYGCTILGDGSLIPVIDADRLLSFAQKQSMGVVNKTSTSPVATQAKIAPGYQSLSATKNNVAPMILVVDDAVTLRRTLALSLKRSGFRVMQAQNGQEAIEELRKYASVQLVICDLEMPRMNGFEFLSHRRQNPQFSRIPVVVLTSRNNQKHHQLAMQLGATAYFTKPYLEQEFITAINNILAETALKGET